MTNTNDNNLLFTLLAKKLSSQVTYEELEQLKITQENDQSACAAEEDLKKVWQKNYFESGNRKILGQQEMSEIIWNRAFPQGFKKKTKRFSLSFISRIAATFTLLFAIGMAISKMIEKKELVEPQVTMINKETLPGQKSTITLSDGTVVWLNSGSRLSFASNFNDSIREIHMDGQAYFEVFKDAKKPFRVYCRDIVVEALGTSFDINGYSDMPMQVSLITGSVRVSDSEKRQEMVLKPGEYSRYNERNEFLRKGEFDPELLLAWKEGKIIFNNATIEVIIARLELWYGVKIENHSTIPMDKPFTGVFEKENLENILTNLGDVMDFDFIIKENQVILKNSTPM
jgi:ferric-dicitrate binding protein FerR (iron transport regulator)